MAPVAASRRRSSTFGNVRRLQSGRYQASYWHEGLRHVAPATFERKADGDAWLATARTDIGRGAWVDPAAGQISVRELSRRWLDANPAKRSSTRDRDETILRLHVLPAIGTAQIASVSKDRAQQLVSG